MTLRKERNLLADLIGVGRVKIDVVIINDSRGASRDLVGSIIDHYLVLMTYVRF